MAKIQIVFHDAGGGHRNAAIALQTVLAEEHPEWLVELVQFQEVTDRLDVLRRLTGIRIQEQYNKLLQNGWTLGSVYLLRLLQWTIRLFHRPLVRLLTKYWQEHPADLLVSVIPHFNREIAESWSAVCPGRPFVTILTDFADFPPRFWLEPVAGQHVICGTKRAVEQARATGKEESRIFPVSGMILRPDFYAANGAAPQALRGEMGLQEGLATGLVLFGGHGSKAMLGIAERLDAAHLPLQLIFICGKNDALATRLRARSWRMPVHIIGFTREVHKYMRAADFLIGKPGPGSIAEAMMCKLPVLLECNSWTLPQERYNTEWVTQKRVGIVLRNFRQVAEGVRAMIEPATLAEFRSNAAALGDRAVFEIPGILAGLMRDAGRA